MSAYRVTIAATAREELEWLPEHIIQRVFDAVRELATHPRPTGCKKLRGHKNAWRVRVGDYRIVYGIDDTAQTVDVVRVAHRREVYE